MPKTRYLKYSILCVLLVFCFVIGMQVFANGTQAFLAIKKVAEEFNDPGSQFLLGHMYYHGQGVPINFKEAAYWYTKSAAQNHVEAQLNLGKMYIAGQGVPQDLTKAIGLLERAAVGNEPEAAALLGDFHAKGDGVKQNFNKAFKYFKDAAENGQSRAQFRLGEMLWNGVAVQQNVSQAVKWWQLSANQQNIDAQFALAKAFFSGRGIPKDVGQGRVWLEQAAKLQHPQAAYEIGRMYANGEGVEVNKLKALAYLKIAHTAGVADAAKLLNELSAATAAKVSKGDHTDSAAGIVDLDTLKKQAEFGNIQNQYELGLLLLKNKNYRNIDQSILWLSKAAYGGHRQAQLLLGDIFSKGEDAMQDYKQAFKWYSMAAKQGDAQAQLQLSKFFQKGLGIEQDIEQSKLWAIRAHAQGHSEAGKLLNQLQNVKAKKDRNNSADLSGSDHEPNDLFKNAEMDNPTAQFELAIHLLNSGNPVQETQAVKYLSRAAELGNEDAQIQLGHVYRFGKGVTANYAIAARWYLKAAQKENKEAQFQLGSLYIEWQDMRQSKVLAKKWFQRAADNGHKNAQSALEKLFP